MHIKGVLKTIGNWLIPEDFQTNDNAVDEYNQFENVVITEKLHEYYCNLQNTMRLLKEYVYFKTVTDEGLILTEKDKQLRAESFYNNLLDCNLIQNGILVPGVEEEIKCLIERR